MSRATADLVWLLLLERSGLVSDAYSVPGADRAVASGVAEAWARTDDVALWGLLGEMFTRHPDWSAQQCAEILRAWVSVRSREPWQAKLLGYWRRWKQHHIDLQTGLARAGALSWTEKCRFCEIWSASRPVMSPFSGVAEILLAAEESLAEVARGSSPGRPERLDTEALEAGYGARKGEVLVVSASETIEDFSEHGAARQLLWALQSCGSPWSLRQPWGDRPELDPQRVRGVIFWSTRQLDRDYVYHAIEIERACRAAKVPVINSILSGWDARHSASLRNLRRAGLPSPRFQRFTEVDEIELAYPLILRVDGLHRGRQMYCVRDADEARQLVSAKRAAFLTPAGRSLPPPNLAVEYVDVADEHGRYNKSRAIVVGNQVLLRHHLVSKSWLVNFASSESPGSASDATRRRGPGVEEDLDIIRRAGRATGSDIVALDYARTREGGYVFWEANRIFIMNGDEDYALPEMSSAGRAARRPARDRKLGESLLHLIKERLASA